MCEKSGMVLALTGDERRRASDRPASLPTFRSPNVFVEHCSAIPCHSMLWRDVTLQFVLYFDIVFDVIACT